MQRKTEITQQDLKFYASQRLTDTDDGGGAMTGVQLNGTTNELFNAVSDLDKTRGRVNVRLAYAAVSRTDAAALLGANVIISEPPEDPAISILACPADYYAQTRAEIMPRIEAYSNPTIASRMTLLGTQRRNSRLVQTYQSLDAPLPLVGERYALGYVDANKQQQFEYFRIDKLTHSIQTFEDDKGTFQVRVIEMETQNALSLDLQGVKSPSRTQISPAVEVLKTQVSDSGKYYGVRPIKKELKQGAVEINVDTIFEKLIPTSTVSTALADDWASGKPLWIPTAPRRVVYAGSAYVSDGNVYFDTGVLPTSVELTGWVDDGLGSLKNSNGEILQIDYAKGVIYGVKNQQIGRIYATPAVKYQNYAYSATSPTKETNQSTEFALLLRPMPARGSVGVSYRAGGQWYELTGYSDNSLRDETGEVRGEITTSGSLKISLPVLPDVGSSLLVSWSPDGFYKTLGDKMAGSVIAPQPMSSAVRLPEIPVPRLKPSTLRLSWHDGTPRTAQDSNGSITGACGGYVHYGEGRFYPTDLNAAVLDWTAEQYIAQSERKSVEVKANGTRMTLSAGAKVAKGSLKISLPIGIRAEEVEKLSESISSGVSSSVATVSTTPSAPRKKVYAFTASTI